MGKRLRNAMKVLGWTRDYEAKWPPCEEAKAEIERLRARLLFHTKDHNRSICECHDCRALGNREYHKWRIE